jgi:hypothetical protein
METAFPTTELCIFLPALNFCYILTQSPWKTSDFFTLADLFSNSPDLLRVSFLFEFLAGVHRGGLSGRALLGSTVFFVQL